MRRTYDWLFLTVVIVSVTACYLLISNSFKTVPDDPITVNEINTEIRVNAATNCVDTAGADISNDLENIIEQISKHTQCSQAVEIAWACAWGSSADTKIVASAANICESELEKNKPSTKLLSLLAEMQSTCREKYDTLEGTMYRSQHAFCYLNALEWITVLSYNEE